MPSAAIDANWLPLFIAVATLAVLVALLAIHRILIRREAARTYIATSVRARRLERERIARELHDTLLQSIHILTWNLHVSAQRLPTACPVRSSIACALTLAESISAEGHGRLLHLRGWGEQRHFVEAVGARGRLIASCGDVSFSTLCSGQPFDLPPEINHEVTLILGEAVVNAFRHAQATRVEFRVRYLPAELCILVMDDGRGMPSLGNDVDSRPSFGMTLMKERASEIGAALDVQSALGGGTRVELRIPSPTPKPADLMETGSSTRTRLLDRVLMSVNAWGRRKRVTSCANTSVSDVT